LLFYEICGVSRHRHLDQRGVLYAAFGVRETMGFGEESAGSCIPEG